ncbi:MAG: hypothetical protein M1815_005077 [Lichina confinis]|nr:MAG: hypothetical protein M1815_005077 [Lichina confinis]
MHPSQHRLALHLQGLYTRLKDYEPRIEYAERLKQISQDIHHLQRPNAEGRSPGGASGARTGILSSLLRPRPSDSLSLTRKLSSHETAIKRNSPRGLLVHGEVGTGKSMLIDLLANSLPTQKKKRWHFNTFMLEAFARLERIRRSQTVPGSAAPHQNLVYVQAEEYCILQIVRDMINVSPILFLDEFQLPDRATSRILSNFLTIFFELGGVLVATSNRMPEELAEASGIEYAASPARSSSLGGPLKRLWGSGSAASISASSADVAHEKNDSFKFLELLKARCEIWEMEGQKDWRRRDVQDQQVRERARSQGITIPDHDRDHDMTTPASQNSMSPSLEEDHERSLPDFYHISASSDLNSREQPSGVWEKAFSKAVGTGKSADQSQATVPWQPVTMQIYGRTVIIPRFHAGISHWTFAELCASDLGPADYISLASRCHTLILIDVPILSFLRRNEALRLITLLDAIYEARCKLLVRAEAGPDDIIFPARKRVDDEGRVPQVAGSTPANGNEQSETEALNGSESTTDSVYSETFAEIHQDLTSPFRPNISSYSSESTRGRTDPVNAADEDSDFGPLDSGRRDDGSASTPDFTRGAGIFTGEDERFAYKRAQSRLWEMCSSRWWARHDDEEEEGGDPQWWRPVPLELRHWERSPSVPPSPAQAAALDQSNESVTAPETTAAEGARDGNTPTNPHPRPPKFSWVHAWGMMKWGQKAGKWGQGVEGLNKKE